ncbi:MAG: ATP-dependent helicase RecQ [Actinomycetota bacterium]|nr:ATP-dependent helicase RecQ [Actinomycetota bacterium]
MSDLLEEANDALRELVGAVAEFRPDQFEAIEALVDARRRVLVVQRTGWGKSAVYFVATRMLRTRGAGPTLLVSPLLSLMRNQIEAGERGGVRAARITSDNTDDWEKIVADLDADRVDLLLVSPERFANPQFRDTVLPDLAERIGLLVIDEAHCISDWGHDFRPDYRRIARILNLLPSGVPVLCTTATANDRVVEDIVAQLGDDLLVLRGALDRRSLALDVLHMPSQAERLAWLAQAIPMLPGTGIVYALTIDDARRVAAWLAQHGIAARAYTGDDPLDARLEVESMLQRNELKCVVATSALGMGYDKPDLAFVIHFQMPGSAIAYYQQVGRAGRALENAHAIALVGHEDRQIQDYFINTAFPPRAEAEQVMGILDEDEWITTKAIERDVNMRHTRLENMLKVLEVEGVVERNRGKWRRTPREWEYPAARVEAVTAARRAEQDRMSEYLSSSSCLMEFLQRELNDPSATPCARCSWCVGDHLLPVEIDRELAREAVKFLQGRSLTLEPRKQWPDGKKIPVDERAELGRVLSHYADGGWGTQVKEQREAGKYSDELAWALADLIAKQTFDPEPEWVTSVPSLRAPALVHDLAERVAARLRLPFVPVVTKSRETKPQREMSNSAQQCANVKDAFSIKDPVAEGPVLLIDDLVDSAWTATTIAALLRQNGSGPVHPMLLAQSRSS